MSTMNPLMMLSNVTFTYGRRVALTNVSLAFDRGAVAIIGENGAGKSTLLSLLVGLKRPATGSYLVNGISTGTRAGVREIQRIVGFLPQHASQPGSARIDEALHYATWLARVPSAARAEAVDNQIAALELSEYRHVKLKALSGGFQQRVKIAQALIGERQALILDEPTTAVDPTHRGSVRDELSTIAKNRLVVFTTHLSEDIEYLADRVIVVSRGRIVGDLTPGELRALGEDSHTMHSSGPYETGLRVLVERTKK